jgi:hypothetical protein
LIISKPITEVRKRLCFCLAALDDFINTLG